MKFTDTRFFRLFRENRTIEDLSAQVADLRHVLFSALQEIEVLKCALHDKAIITEADYKRHRIEVMLNDHSSLGPSPWKGHSQYKYTLDETEFNREVLRLSESELEQFKKNSQVMETMT